MPVHSMSRLRWLSIFVLFFTGASGLIYEVTWFKYLANLIGSEARASALILSVFLGGLAIGYALFGRFSANRSVSALMKLTGWLEIGIGVWAILFPILYAQTWGSMSALFQGDFNVFLEVGMACFLILPPTILMGGTLPLLTQALSLSVQESEKIHAAIYAVNTAGAFLGCLVAGFYLIPHFGLPLSMMGTALLNFVAGLAFLMLGTSSKTEQSESAESTPSPHRPSFLHIVSDRRSAIAHGLALLCGFIAITLQTALMRLVGLTAGSSEYAFAIVVSVFILMLAWGSYRVASRPQSRLNRLWVNQLILFGGLVLIFWMVPELPYFLHVVRALLTSVAINFYVFQVLLFLTFTAVLIIPVHAMGRSMPLLFAGLKREAQDLGQHVGTLYFANTLGCVLGGLVGGYALYFFFDLDRILMLCEGLALVTFVLAVFLSDISRLKAIAVCGLGLVVVALSPTWEAKRLALGTFRMRSPVQFSFHGSRYFYEKYSPRSQVLYRRDGPTSSMAVTQDGDEKSKEPFTRAIIVNGKSDGETLGDRTTTELIGHLPALFATTETQNVAVIGFGTGMTAGALSVHPQVQKIDIFEISPLVHEYAHFFDFANHQMSTSSKVRWQIGDAYQKLRTSPQKYAVIASEPSNPWVLGVERLFSREFLDIAKAHLEPGGIYAQWIHSYELSESTLALVLSTYTSVFKHIRVFRVGDYDLAILGSEKEIADDSIAALERKLQIPVIKDNLAQIKIKSVYDVLALEVLWSKEFFENRGLHSLEFPKLAYAAGYDFFMLNSFDIPTLQDKPEMKAWTHRTAQKSLGHRLNQMRPSPETLKGLVSAWCLQDKTDFAPNWRSRPRTCRQGLAMAVQARLLENKNGFLPWEIDLLFQKAASKFPHPASVAVAEQNSNEAGNRLRFIDEYDLALQDMTPEDILNIGSGCGAGESQDSQMCRAQLVMTLSTFGAWREAEGEYQRLADRKIPDALRFLLQSAIEQSKRATASIFNI